MSKYTKEQMAGMSDEELVHAELQLDRDLVTLRFQKKAGNGKDMHKSKEVRRNIARLRTEQIAREKAAGLAKNSLRDQYRSTFQISADDLASQAAETGSFASEL